MNFSRSKKMAVLTTSLAAAAWMTLSSCNLFSIVDSPSSDEQILSRARACFDRGDFDCAREYYAKLSTTSLADVALAEEAFVLLDEQGSGMGNFLDAFSSSSGGGSITRLANLMIQVGDGPTPARRAKIFEAFRKAKAITAGDPNQGLVRFIASAALTAQLLGEEAIALSQEQVTAATISDDPTTCSTDTTNCGTNSSCPRTGGMPTGISTYDLWADGTTALTGTRDLQMLKAAISEISAGLSTLGVGGDYSVVSSFSGNIAAEALSGAGGCFRSALLSEGIGTE